MKQIFFWALMAFTAITFAQSKVVKPLIVNKGKLLFSDEFERKEGLGSWTVAEKFTGAFSIQNGVWVTKEIEGAGHGSTARINLKYKDVVIEFDFQFKGGKRFNIVMDDKNCKSVWAGHIARASFSRSGFYVRDDKTGAMNLKIRNQIKDNPKKKNEMKPFLDSKMAATKFKFEEGKWYHVVITKKQDILECKVGNAIVQLKSNGIDHGLNKFGPTITGADILFDNLKIWEILK